MKALIPFNRGLAPSLRSPPSARCPDSELQTGVQPTCAPVPDHTWIISMPSNRIYRTQYWSVTLPSDWTTSTDGDDLHVFISPDGTATIRLSTGVIWRRGVIDDATIRAIARESGAPGAPIPARLAGIEGFETGRVTDSGERTRYWWLRSGRLVLPLELEIRSASHQETPAHDVLSTLTIDHSAVAAHPVEMAVYGHIGRIVGTVAGHVWVHRYLLAFLVVAALLIMLGVGR